MMSQEQEIPTFSIESLSANTSDPDPREFDLFRLEFLTQDMDHLRSPHRYPFYAFILITEGSGNHDIDFTNYPLCPNRLFIISPGQVHAWRHLEKVRGFVVVFTDSFVALSNGRNIMTSWPIFQDHETCFLDLQEAETKRWTVELLHMESELFLKDEFTQDALFYSLGNLLVRASRLSQQLSTRKSIAGPDVLFAFQELIEEKFPEARMPRDYAPFLNITPNYLNALCKKKLGKSAGELIRERVLLEAKRLLTHTQLSVAEIGHRLNFEDNSYFGRYFKKYIGMTPDTFRKNGSITIP